MDWSKGFFRIWILLSVIWIAIMGWASWPKGVEHEMYYSPFDDAFHVPPPPPEWNFGCDKLSSEVRAKCVEVAKTIGKGISVTLPDEPRLTMSFPVADESGWETIGKGKGGDGRETSIPSIIIYPTDNERKILKVAGSDLLSDNTRARFEELGGKAKETFHTAVIAQRVNAVKSFALQGILPPLALLGAGFALAWVIAGFRRRK